MAQGECGQLLRDWVTPQDGEPPPLEGGHLLVMDLPPGSASAPRFLLVRVGEQPRNATKLSLQIQPGEHAPSDID